MTGALLLKVAEEYKAQLQVAPPSVGTHLWNRFVQGWRGLSDTALDLTGGLLAYGPTVLFWLALLFLPARLAWRRSRART